jgi:hypothetical protein
MENVVFTKILNRPKFVFMFRKNRLRDEKRLAFPKTVQYFNWL